MLAVELFSCLTEAKVLTEVWRQDYNRNRPHSSLGMMTPSAFAPGYRTYLETLEQLSPLGGADPELADQITNNNNQLSL